jgi:putative flavoprotein involved in K+ transport
MSRPSPPGDSAAHFIRNWVDRFNAALAAPEAGRVAELFSAESYWRDLLALTGDIRTFAGRDLISATLPGLMSGMSEASPTPVELEDRAPRFEELQPFGRMTGAFLRFDTVAGHCRGYVRLAVEPGDDFATAFTLLTSLEELHSDGGPPAADTTPDEPEVLIVGAGHAGLGLAARLAQLGIPAQVIERNRRVGDNWRLRYGSLRLHNQLVSCHLPARPFPDDWPTYLPKDMVAGFLGDYAQDLDLDVRTGVEVIGGDHHEGAWRIEVRDDDGAVRTVRPRYVVMATGVTGSIPKAPTLPGADTFRGTWMHSSAYTGTEDVGGKRVVVVGAGASGHDIAQDIYHRGAANVTMVQRSSVTVVSLKSAEVQYAIYRDAGSAEALEDIDFVNSSVPNLLARKLWVPITEKLVERDKDLLDGLGRAGFLTDQGEDGSGFIVKSMMTYGGFYINVGASEMIIDGKIEIRAGVGISHLADHEVVLSDGSRLEADLLILATGFEPMQADIRRIFGPEIAERVGPIWGVSPRDGELRGVWRPTGQPGFLVMGGGLAHCRIYSRYVALQIQRGLRCPDPTHRVLAPAGAPAAEHATDHPMRVADPGRRRLGGWT